MLLLFDTLHGRMDRIFSLNCSQIKSEHKLFWPSVGEILLERFVLFEYKTKIKAYIIEVHLFEIYPEF